METFWDFHGLLMVFVSSLHCSVSLIKLSFSHHLAEVSHSAYDHYHYRCYNLLLGLVETSWIIEDVGFTPCKVPDELPCPFPSLSRNPDRLSVNTMWYESNMYCKFLQPTLHAYLIHSWGTQACIHGSVPSVSSAVHKPRMRFEPPPNPLSTVAQGQLRDCASNAGDATNCMHSVGIADCWKEKRSKNRSKNCLLDRAFEHPCPQQGYWNRSHLLGRTIAPWLQL